MSLSKHAKEILTEHIDSDEIGKILWGVKKPTKVITDDSHKLDVFRKTNPSENLEFLRSDTSNY